MEPNNCQKDWFVKWTQILDLLVCMIPITKGWLKNTTSARLSGAYLLTSVVSQSHLHYTRGQTLCLTVANLQLY